MKSVSTSTLLNALFVFVITLGSSVAMAYRSVGTLLSATGLADPIRQPSTNGAMDDFQNASDTASNAQTPGNVSELKQMVQARKLTELRVTYNGNYGAALFFYPQDMVYYVALFQDKNFWRVVKSRDNARAEAVCAQFARKSYALAEDEIRHAQLQAQKALLERVIVVSNDRAQRLTADLSIARARESEVSQRQQQMQLESAALQNDKSIAKRKLLMLQRQVQQLQDQSVAGLVQ
ncbi:DUF2968 domain-containing protein [Caballeronia sp. SEWSISQ10-4 2]|uniref:DUF2968 domain-containing protein n=1 Tax=Caballeronia sp. SEWSISQ10-4 2 TaxID=2937438 RepID=UPI002654E38D|nr:DUF2968 domain-containing protein [Caballeronia sp. SEWSISQ10-4 2]MDN7181917.1 DUF2968 domain-containing protein [Caballeronia sp. SEWSISQ10-4 2]